MSEQKREADRRKIERREPKRGVNIRHDDTGTPPRRIRWGQMEKKKDD